MTTASYSLKSMSNYDRTFVDSAYYSSLSEIYENFRTRQPFIHALEQIGEAPCDGCPYRAECKEGKACADFYTFMLEMEEGDKKGRVLYRLSREPGGRVPLKEIYNSIFDPEIKFYRSSKAAQEKIERLAHVYPRPA